MPPSLFFPVCALLFSLPAATLCLLAWPTYPGRPIPNALDADATAIAGIALVFGCLVALLLGARLRRLR